MYKKRNYGMLLSREETDITFDKQQLNNKLKYAVVVRTFSNPRPCPYPFLSIYRIECSI